MPPLSPTFNEVSRLQALQQLQILDSDADPDFDQLTALARSLFDVPIVLVSLMDANRQWFKSCQGLDITETPREISFCNYVVADNTPLVIEDTHKDSRFVDNPLVINSPHIRFYAGAPLQPDGTHTVGTLCVIDDQPRTFSSHEHQLLQGLAKQAEALLRHHQLSYDALRLAQRYETIFDESPTGVIRLNTQGLIKAVNPFASELLGYSSDELIGRNVSMLMPPLHGNHHDSYLDAFLRGGQPRIIGRGREVEALHRLGHQVPVHLAVNAIDDIDGRTIEFLGILTDLSDIQESHQRIEQEQALLRVLHRGITDYGILMSGDRLWHFLLDALLDLTGSDYALIGEKVHDDGAEHALKIHAITDLSWSDESRQLMEKLRSGDMRLTNPDSLLGRVFAYGDVIMTNDLYQHPLRGGFPPGHPRLENYLGVPIFSDDKVIGMFAIANSAMPYNQRLVEWLQPFTDACALLINLYHQMEELEEARHNAERANQAKSDFLSSMSHELRTPLNAILGFAQLLNNGRRTPLTDRQRRQVTQIEKSGQHLLSLINDVLDLAKIEAGHVTLSLEPVQVSALIDDALTLIQPSADANHILLSVSPTLPIDVYITADYTRIKQVLLNLLSNAIKYNRPDGSVKVNVWQQAQTVSIGVHDTGPGIAEQDLPQLFEPFNRLQAANGSIEGTGIGLTITRQLIEQMQGTLEVRSRVEEGSHFIVTLPLAESSLSQPSPDSPAENTKGSTQVLAQILYIEDNPANQRLMEDIFDEEDTLSLTLAHSAEIGLELLSAQAFDLVIMDINLPGMSGFQALDMIRLHQKRQYLPVMALTAHADQQDKTSESGTSFDAYLTKPIEVVNLLTTLESLLEPY